MTRPTTDSGPQQALAALTLVLGAVAVFTLRALLAPLIVGAFFAGLTAPWAQRLAARFGRRTRVAGLATALLVIVLVLPVALLAIPIAGLIGEGIDVVTRVAPSSFMQRLTQAAAGPQTSIPSSAHDTFTRLWQLGQQFVPGTAALVSRFVGTVSHTLVQILVLVASAYVFTAEGKPMIEIARRGSPLAPAHFDRLVADAMSMARALLVGGVLTSLTQGVVATVIYAVLGVPNAILFGGLTGIAAMVPVVGTALVWIPLCAVLVGAGHPRGAVVLGVLGLSVISTVDNLLRPFLGRIGSRDVHPLLLFVGVMGGLSAFGPWGLVLGPLVLAMFVCAYRLRAEA